MKQKRSVWPHRCFVLAFLVLTFFCWCPLLYGSYGPARRILGIPSWAVWAFVFGALLFILEWIYLFLSKRVMDDESLPDIVSELTKLDLDGSTGPKEDA
jgi:hypothetical protein